MKRDIDDSIICPNNSECRCEDAKCEKCGWDPTVAEHRLADVKRRMGIDGKFYRIPVFGYYEVYAYSAEHALEKAEKNQVFTDMLTLGEPICMEREAEDGLGK